MFILCTKKNMIRFLVRQFSLILFFLATTFSSFAQQAKLEADINDIIKQYKAIGLSVAVIKKDSLIYQQAFGLKDLDSQEPLTETDIFRIASISKSFSATAIMQLVEQGKLSLSDDFSKLIGFKVRNPKFPEKVITLKMVLSHTSSINDREGYFSLDAINPNKNPNWAKCYNDYEPGKGYQYCNLNYNMVGAVIEKVSGQRFDEYMKAHILDPLGLYGGYCVDSLDKNRFVTLYSYNDAPKNFTSSPMAYNLRSEELKQYILGYSTPLFSPTGGMKISAIDLAKYMSMHLNMGTYKGVKIISKKSAKIMQTQISSDEGYGLAIETNQHIIKGKKMKGHTGSAYGLYSAMFFNPQKKFGIVAITNGCLPVFTNGMSVALMKTINSLYANLLNSKLN